jgi:photosystem II stability/assembly factor-like uncharacterized protein
MIPRTQPWFRPLCTSLLVILSVGAPAGAADRTFGSVRDIQVVDKTIWAVGDGGLILQSRDGGETFQPGGYSLDSGLNVQALRRDGPSVCLLGGRAVEGFPRGGALGVLRRSDDGGETFTSIPTGSLGWLYDGIVISDSALLVGQAIPTVPGGVAHTVDAGKHWRPIPLRARGYLRSAVFDGFRFGYLVGANRRIVSLRDFGEPEYHPAPIASTAELQAVTMTGNTAGWCVGRDGSVLASQPNTAAWRQKLLPIPSGTRRLTDFETIDARDRRFCVAGGLTGLMFFSDDAGNSFTARPAPGPGPVHVVRYLPGPNGKPRLLAGGDAGRIWRSDDDGRTWRLVHGPDKTDVLFIVAAGDTSIYPAVVAHAAAGLSTTVVYATTPQGNYEYPDAPNGQWLRAAAVRAGANGVTVLRDFPSVAQRAEEQTKSAEDILAAWSDSLDAPARPILLNQLAAVIRQYRPTVVAVGFDQKGREGTSAENRLIARLAQQAATIAADKEASPSLAKAKLPPHAVKRIYVGLPENARYTPPWSDSPPLPTGRGVVRVNGAAFPRGRKSSVAMLAQEAVWLLGDPSLLNRPALVTGYVCRTASKGGELFTQGLGINYFSRAKPSPLQKMAASGAPLRAADMGDRIMTALPDLLRAAAEKPKDGFDPSLAAADRILLTWRRLCEQGRIVQATQARDEFLRVGKSHPLYRMMNVRTLATTCSTEYNAQRVRVTPDVSPMDAAAGRAAKKFASWHPWADDGPGRMLLTRTILATASPNEIPRARARALKVLGAMIRGSYPDVWRQRAAFESDCLHHRPYKTVGRIGLVAPIVTQPGDIDGRLDEDAWKTAPVKPLLPPGGTSKSRPAGGEVRVIRTSGSVVLGLALPARVGRVWRVTVAVDVDRDAWTQLQIEFDTTGRKAGYLACRLGPRTKLDAIVGDRQRPESRLFFLQAPRNINAAGQHTFELAIPIQQTGVDPRERGLWNFQIRATAEDAAGVRYFYLQPQNDPELRPERFGLLEYPPMM